MDYLKRIWVCYFNTDRILNSIKTRKGKCKKCGKCCNIYGIKCPFLNKENKCSIYKFRPTLLCKIGPLNLTKGEIKKHEEIDCGFYWESQKKK